MDRNNIVWCMVAGLTAPVVGSVLTVVLWGAFLLNAVSAITRRFPLRYDAVIYICSVVAAAYGGVKLIFTIAHSGFDGWQLWPNLFVFLTPAIVLPRLRLSDPAKILDAFILGCGFSTLLAVPLAAYEVIWLGQRAESLCGNPGVFAVMATLFGSIGTLNAASPRKFRRWLGVLSYFAMVFCVLATGMRTMWIAAALTTAVIIWSLSASLPVVVLRRAIAASVAVLFLGLAFAAEPLWDRTAQIGADIAALEQSGDYDTSTGRRLLMLEGAWSAIEAAPLTGYGLTNRMDAVRAHLPERYNELVSYSHPHNGFLAAILDAGLLGLVALLALLIMPVWLSARAERDEIWRPRMAAAMILTLSYTVSGLTNIMFEHDLMNSAFLVTLIVIAASIAPQRQAQASSSASSS